MSDTPTPTPTPVSSAAISSVDIAALTTSGGNALPAEEPTKVNCTVDGLRSVRWTATFSDGRRSAVDAQLPEPASAKAAWEPVPFGPGWLMAVVPGQVKDLDVVTDGPNEGGYFSVGAGPLATVASTCLAIRFDSADEAGKVKGLVWRGTDGVFRKDSGETLPFVDVPVDNDRISLYSDAQLDVFGVITTSGTAISYKPRKSTDPFPSVLFSTVQREDGRWRTFFVGVLPAGSTDVRLTYPASAFQPTLRTATAATGEVFLVAEAGTASPSGEVFDTVTYTGPDGRQVRPSWG